MSSDPQSAPTSNKLIWSGRIITTLVVLMLTMSAVMKFMQPDGMAEGMEKLGWPMKLAVVLGIIELLCTLLYAIPQTAVVGAILLTGYFGGATATHLRIGDSVVGPVLFGVVVWLGLFLRDSRLRALIPWRA